MGKSCSKRIRNEQKTSDSQVTGIQDFLNPRAKHVNVHHVQIGCSVYGADAQPSTSETHNKKDDDAETQKTKRENEEAAIRSTLKNLYEKITLPSLPWIEDADMPMKYFTKLQLEFEGERSVTQIIELDNLFDAVNEKNPRRILIESQPGFGKTTLTHKIISDWFFEKNYVKRFKFAFLIVLRSLKTRALKDEIIEIINNKCEAKDEIWEIINDEETLLILDGLDEVGENVRADIVKILYDVTNESKMIIVTTCRTGLSRFKREEVESIVGGLSIKKEFWCKKIAVLGISEEDRDVFLGNFIKDEEKDEMMLRIQEIVDCGHDDKKKLFKSPLMLILLVYVMRENHEIKIKSRPDLCRYFVSYISRRSTTKTNLKASMDNFADTSINANQSILFYKFGEMCLENFLNHRL